MNKLQDGNIATPLKPSEIVVELNRYIVGQSDAKRAVAIAIRNRWRRQQLPSEMQAEVSPKNIMMIGSTGVGKTEIARRLAKLTNAPFIKVEATKYTEVGYYGRDVESMIRELLDNSISLVRDIERERVRKEADKRTTDKLVDLLCPLQSTTLCAVTRSALIGRDVYSTAISISSSTCSWKMANRWKSGTLTSSVSLRCQS